MKHDNASSELPFDSWIRSTFREMTAWLDAITQLPPFTSIYSLIVDFAARRRKRNSINLMAICERDDGEAEVFGNQTWTLDRTRGKKYEFLPLTKFKNIQEIICVEKYFREGRMYKFCYDSPEKCAVISWQRWVRDVKKGLGRLKEHDQTWKLPIFKLCEVIKTL
jgi:hypothetical protein